MQLYYTDAKKYKEPTPSGKWRKLKYDIRELRLRPGKLTKWYLEQEQEAERTRTMHSNAQKKEKLDNATQEWRNYKNKLGEALQKICPLSKKRQTRKNQNGSRN